MSFAVLALSLLSATAHPDLVPDDPRFPEQWALQMIHAPSAWARSTGSRSVTVAILDTGITPHPDLIDRLVPGYDFVSDPGEGGDGDGRDADPTDTGPWTHGTHVAGIVGASTDNALGIAGMDWACRVQPIRVVGRGGVGRGADVADAIRWAAGAHVDGVPDNPTPAGVINLSFTTPGRSDAMQEAIEEAVARGAIVVAAAGNEGLAADGVSPGGLAHVITVGAVDEHGRTSEFSNWGPTVALMAPGGSRADGVLSTQALPRSGYTYLPISGTSQAAPYVTGTIALMRSIAPGLGAAEARALLTRAADPAARCASDDDPSQPGCGAGLLDAGQSLRLTEAFRSGELRLDLDEGAPAMGCAIATSSGAPRGALACFLVLAWLARRRVLKARRR